MKNFGLTLLLLAVCSLASAKDCKADLVFSIVQSTPTNNAPLVQGESNAGAFDILIRSTVANQSFLGADFTLTLNRLDGKGGLFASGINVLMPNSSNPEGFIRGTFDNGPLGQVLYSTIANQPLTLGSSDTVLARVVMTTVGVDGVFPLLRPSGALASLRKLLLVVPCLSSPSRQRACGSPRAAVGLLRCVCG